MSRLFRTRSNSSDDRFGSWAASQRIELLSAGLGLASFVATEVMHHLLVPDIGRHLERLLAEGVSAAVVALLTGRLLHAENQRRQAALLRMQVISEMNHHIRNALSAIRLTADVIPNQQSLRVISESIDRIEWALREILLRRKPLQEHEENRLRYFERQRDGRQQLPRGPTPYMR